MKNRTRYSSVVLAALLPVIVVSAAQSGCKKEEEALPPVASALPSAVPAPTPTPVASATIVPEEDAGLDAAADADAAKPATGTGGGASASIAKCCTALQQNANSAPPEQKGAYQAAASACNGLRNMPAAQQAFAQLRSFLAGAKMPSACQ